MDNIHQVVEKITKNLSEVISLDLLKKKLESKKPLSAYIGFAPTGKIHIGYLIPCMKIRDLTECGIKVVIMLADVHAMIDDRKTPKDLIGHRTLYYEKVLSKIMQVLKVDARLVTFVKGSDFQLTGDYMMDVLELSNNVTISAAKKAGTEVVKQNKDPKLGSALYPVMQAVDENYVGQIALGQQIDIELGGADQRKIFCFSKDHDIKRDPLTYLMNPIISLNKTGKMSSSDANGKISLEDTDEMICEKIQKSFCADGQIDCGVMKLFQCVLFPIFHQIVIKDKIFVDFEAFSSSFASGEIRAVDIKPILSDCLIQIVSEIRSFLMSDEMLQLGQLAYSI
jgi:tyrosyl-tRNA synthetase